MRVLPIAIALTVASCGACGTHGAELPTRSGACFDGQVKIERFCIDKYEAYVVELRDDGEHPHSPYDVIGDLRVRAKVAPNVAPQAYISQVQAKSACAHAGKRLCKGEEHLRACRGKTEDFYPYGGRVYKKGVCNEGKGSFIAAAHGMDFKNRSYAEFNDPKLNQMENGLAKTGAFAQCVSPDGVYDLVGNLHEWVDEPSGNRGHFHGGWYGDAEQNGPGCHYVTSAHEITYHDYSTGFRCCADAVE